MPPDQARWPCSAVFVDLHDDASVEITAKRKLLSKTAVSAPWLEQVGSVGNAARDPRGWSVTTLYMALIAHAPTASFVDSVDDVPGSPWDQAARLGLAFNHARWLKHTQTRLNNKPAYTTFTFHLVSNTVSSTSLKPLYELFHF